MANTQDVNDNAPAAVYEALSYLLTTMELLRAAALSLSLAVSLSPALSLSPLPSLLSPLFCLLTTLHALPLLGAILRTTAKLLAPYLVCVCVRARARACVRRAQQLP